MKGDRETVRRARRDVRANPFFPSAIRAAARTAIAAAFSVAAGSTGVHAVTLGGFEVQSALGQALRMSVQVNARPDEEIDANCFRLNPFSVAGDGLPQLTTAQMRLESRNGAQRLVITSPRAIMDPIVRIAIDVGCDTTLRREITLLLDPPTSAETLPQVAEARPSAVPIPSTGSGASSNPFAGRSGAPSAPSAPSTPAAREGAATPSPAPGSVAGSRAAAVAEANAARRNGQGAITARPAESSRRATGTLSQFNARPPRSLQPAEPRASSNAMPRSARAPAGSGDRLTISSSPLALESSGSSFSPRLNLTTSLSSPGGPSLSESILALLRQNQARLRAAPPDQDLPSLEAEVVVLQKRATDLQRQLSQALGQIETLKGGSPGSAPPPASANPPAASAPATTPSAATPPAAAPATPGAAPTVATSSPPAPAGEKSAAPDKASSAFEMPAWLNESNLMAALLLGIIALVLLLFLLVWLKRERKDQRRADQWSYVPTVPGSATDPKEPTITTAAAAATAAAVAETKADADLKSQSDTFGYKPYSSGQAARELGVSDLAQATEKASVFVTLGRPAQAIDVLRDHIDHEPKSSPMAWLMLLDLYRQTNRYEDFTEVAQRFHLEFNAVTPEWAHPAGTASDPGLAAFPYLIAKIRDNWPTAQARAFLEELLYDNRGGSRLGFSLPSFKDLLLLHGRVDEYLHALDRKGSVDPSTGRIVEPPEPPAPPEHLAAVWKTATHDRPVYATPLPDPPTPPAPHSPPVSPQSKPLPFTIDPAPLPDFGAPLATVHPAASRGVAPASMGAMSVAPMPEDHDVPTIGLVPPLQFTSSSTASAPSPAPAAPMSPLPPLTGPTSASTNSAPAPSALEKSYPIIAEAIVNRWHKPGLAAYLSNLIRSSTEHGAGLTNEALAELILLHDVALDLGEPDTAITLVDRPG